MHAVSVPELRQRARGAEGTLPCNERGPKEELVSSFVNPQFSQWPAAAWPGARCVEAGEADSSIPTPHHTHWNDDATLVGSTLTPDFSTDATCGCSVEGVKHTERNRPANSVPLTCSKACIASSMVLNSTCAYLASNERVSRTFRIIANNFDAFVTGLIATTHDWQPVNSSFSTGWVTAGARLRTMRAVLGSPVVLNGFGALLSPLRPVGMSNHSSLPSSRTSDLEAIAVAVSAWHVAIAYPLFVSGSAPAGISTRSIGPMRSPVRNALTRSLLAARGIPLTLSVTSDRSESRQLLL